MQTSTNEKFYQFHCQQNTFKSLKVEFTDMSYTIIDPFFTFSGGTVKTDQIKQCMISTLRFWSDRPYISVRTILDQILDQKLQYAENVMPVI